MEATLRQNLNIDKTNWTLVKFGDVVYEPKETMKDIVAEGIKHVVGLEHITTDDIHLRNSAGIEESTTFTKKFAKGDVLFGRRRAYLRKAAQAPFGGICSGDITVFRAKKELLPELLPFVVSNEKFFDYAIKHSAGGLSPRVKFKDLADYEFLLPPKDQQAQLAELLWTMDEVIEREIYTFNSIDNLFKSKAKFISETKLQPKSELKKVKEVCFIKDNLRKPLNSTERNLMKGEIPYYGANGIVDFVNNYIFDEDLILLAEDGGNFNEYYTKEIAYKVKGRSWVNNHAHVLSLIDKNIPIDWLFFSFVHKNILKHIIGSTRLKLNKSELENIDIWIPNDNLIKKLVDEMNEIFTAREISFAKKNSTKTLQKSIINQLF